MSVYGAARERKMVTSWNVLSCGSHLYKGALLKPSRLSKLSNKGVVSSLVNMHYRNEIALSLSRKCQSL